MLRRMSSVPPAWGWTLPTPAAMAQETALASALTISVRVAAVPGTYRFTTTVSILPLGKTIRKAKQDEVRVQVQYEWGAAQWTTFATGSALTGGDGVAEVVVPIADMRFEGAKYRVWAKHIASGAEAAKEFTLAFNGASPANVQYTYPAVGTEMPATFQQPRRYRPSVYPLSGLHR